MPVFLSLWSENRLLTVNYIKPVKVYFMVRISCTLEMYSMYWRRMFCAALGWSSLHRDVHFVQMAGASLFTCVPADFLPAGAVQFW